MEAVKLQIYVCGRILQNSMSEQLKQKIMQENSENLEIGSLLKIGMTLFFGWSDLMNIMQNGKPCSLFVTFISET